MAGKEISVKKYVVRRDRTRHAGRLRHAGIKVAAKGRPLPGTFASGWKHRMDGGWERRAIRRSLDSIWSPS
jgi:hypothetical protein